MKLIFKLLFFLYTLFFIFLIVDVWHDLSVYYDKIIGTFIITFIYLMILGYLKTIS